MSIELKLLLMLCLLAVLGVGVMLYPLRKDRMRMLLCAPLIFVLLALAYWHWGAWPALREHQQRLRQQQRVQTLLKNYKGPQALIEKLSERLHADPKSARGWYLLGRLYASQNQWPKANDSFERAHALQPDNDQITINYVQSSLELNQSHLTLKGYTLLRVILKKNPQQPDALALLAMDAYDKHEYVKAIHYWQRLLALVPTQSEEARALRQAIAKAQKNL